MSPPLSYPAYLAVPTLTPSAAVLFPRLQTEAKYKGGGNFPHKNDMPPLSYFVSFVEGDANSQFSSVPPQNISSFTNRSQV